jgi:hypothetical protein
MTNFIQTDQVRSVCPESVVLAEAVCETDSQCQNKQFSPNLNGRWTGRCVLPTEANAWNETKNMIKQKTGLCEYAGRLIHNMFVKRRILPRFFLPRGVNDFRGRVAVLSLDKTLIERVNKLDV